MLDKRHASSLLFISTALIPGSIAHAQTALPSVPVAQAVDEKGVDLISQTLMLEDPGLSIGEPDSGGLTFTRTWAGPGGYQLGGWDHNFDYHVSFNTLSPPNGATVTMGQRSISFLTTTGSNPVTYTPQQQDGTSLAASGNTLIFTDKDGTQVTFSSNVTGTTLYALGTVLVRPDGERLTFVYNQFSNGTAIPYVYLQSVQTNFGYHIQFSYPNQQLAVSQVEAINDSVDYCNPAAAICSGLANYWPTVLFSRSGGTLTATSPYEYASSYIETETDPTGNTRSFSISPSATSEVMTSRTPGPSGTQTINYTWNIYQQTNPPPPNVTSITDSSGQWTYSNNGTLNPTIVGANYTNLPTSIKNTIPTSEVFGNYGINTNYSTIARTSPGGGIYYASAITPVGLNYIPLVVSTLDEIGRTTYYQYDTAARPTTAVLPEGTLSGSTPASDYVQNAYDTRGNVVSVTKVPKAGSPLANIVYQAGYDATCTMTAKCNKPNWVKDALGNETDYTYDPTHGGMLSEMKPAPSSGAARPLVLTTWTQIYGWLANSSGTLVQQANPIWRMATKTECQTVGGSSTPTCDTGAQQTLSTYQYGTAGTRFALLVKGVAVSSGGVTLRTCYNYDIYGRKISETKPNAGLGGCP